MKRFFWLFAALFACVVASFGADATGAWTGQMPTRDGETREVNFKLKQSGAALTGTMSAFDNDVAIQDGKIDGDKLNFTVTLEFNGNSFKILFTGVLKGDEIAMTREREDGDNKQSFTVKRASS
jgi:hypothetical protein